MSCGMDSWLLEVAATIRLDCTCVILTWCVVLGLCAAAQHFPPCSVILNVRLEQALDRRKEGDEMAELFVAGFVAVIVLAAFGLLAALASFLWWVILLPFKLLAFTFKGLAALLALPFLLLFGFLGFLLFGVGMLAFLLPALPFVLIALLIVALFRRRDRPRSSATVV
jgi:hypothetical protein